MKVCEIFKSIEGEGIRTGLPAVFVRLHGCNLRCSYCDSMYAVEGSDYKTMDLQQVLEAVKGYGVKNVTLTGGEPLLHQGVAELLETLSREGFRVNVETNGTVPAKWRLPGLFYTMDWKCKSSAMSSHMKLENMETIGEGDVLKFVVGSVEDLEETESVVERLAAKKSAQALQKNLPDGDPQGMPSIFVSPVFGKLSNVEIVNWMLASDVMVKNDARFQVQLHKVVWDPDLRGV